MTGRRLEDQLELGFDAPRVTGRPAGRDGAGGPGRGGPPGPGGPEGPRGPGDEGDRSRRRGTRRLGAVELARALDRPEPTPEQVAVIEADVEPLLVVAGAGSGKTETMAARVVWLVANGHVAPEEVLGLTFTRKAAGELAERVRARLRALYRRGLVDREPAPVTVSTYHSYAAGVVGDHGLRLGIEPGARLLGEAGAWQLAAEIVDRWDGDMTGVDSAATTVTEAVLSLAGECAEHLVDVADLEPFLTDLLERVEGLPGSVGDAVPGRITRPVRDRLDQLVTRVRLVPLVRAYVRRKRDLEVLDFGDQVALAARLARDVPEVGAGERARYGVVLLDEYQDTSHAQLVLLRSLFAGGHPVTAVGDPHQSIYGWRGASAGNLQRFPEDFPVRADGGAAAARPAPVRLLSTSWRNDAAVLAVANAVAADLRVPAPWTSAATVDVPGLVARPGAGPGEVRVAWLPTAEDEARAVAEVIDTAWRAGPTPPTAAVLCRTRSQFPLVDAQLRARGLPVEVVGLGGLLSRPEIVDLRAALEVLHDPTRGDSLMRLLTGPALRIGPADLEALGAWSAERSGGRRRGRVGEVEPDVVDERSLVEALDVLPPPEWSGPAGQELTAEARARLDRFAGTLRDLRGRTGLALPDLVLDVERALLLDVEVAATPGIRPAAARAHLDAFADVAAGFAATGDRPGLGAFLAWLAAADERERGLDVPLAEVRRDAVQVLTVHAAKGLEWDVVAVTGLVEGTFPTGHAGRPPSESNGWLGGLGGSLLPYPLRGDAAGLPRWEVEHCSTQKQVADELARFRTWCGLHDVAEERRLAYVAVTRARSTLLLTGAVWGTGTRPRVPSRFLQEAREVPGVTVAVWEDDPEPGTPNPSEGLAPELPWPRDVLGDRRPVVERAADAVWSALVADLAADRGDDRGDDRVDEGGSGGLPPDPWGDEVDLLLAERDAGERRRVRVRLPAHLSASRLVALARDPAALALRLRRPMPEPPSPHARRGSAFHAWLEQRFGAAALVDLDELPGAADDAAGDEELGRLQAAFLASEWADRTPEAVEVAVETPVGPLMLRGRIDAVFRSAGEDGLDRWDVVDWKTGPPPRDDAARDAVAVQLAVYRLAWSRLADVPVERVSAAFVHVGHGRTVRPADLLDAAGLAALVQQAVVDDPADGSAHST